MLKKITVVLLGVCVTSMTLTGVQAADFNSGDSDSKVEIEFQEEDNSTDKTESEDAEDGLFSDGSDDIQTGELSAIANQIATQVQSQAQDYQTKRQEARKVIDAREVERRAQEIKEDPKGSPGGRTKEGGTGAGSTQREDCTVCTSVCGKSLCVRRYKSDKWCRLFRICDVCF